MCIWKVAAEDRKCQYCSYRGGCEKRDMGKEVMLDGLCSEYVSIMSELIGADIMTKNKSARMAWARYMVFYKLKQKGMGVSRIGEKIGRKHCSVIHGVYQVQNMLEFPSMYRDEMDLWRSFTQKIEENE